MFSQHSYWKFAIAAVLLPSCLGFEIAAAQPKYKSEYLSARTQSQKEGINVISHPVTETILREKDLDSEADKLKHKKYRRHYRTRYRRRHHHKRRPYRYHYHRRHHHKRRPYRHYYYPRHHHLRRRYHRVYRNRHHYPHHNLLHRKYDYFRYR